METTELLKQVKDLINEQATIHRSALDEIKRTGTVPDSTKSEIERLANEYKTVSTAYTDVLKKHDDLAKANEQLQAKTAELEGRLNRKGTDPNDPLERKSFGDLVVEDADFKAAMEQGVFERRGQVRKVRLDGRSLKDFISSAQGQYLIIPDRQTGIMPMPNLPLTARAIIPSTTTASNAVEYVKESLQTNNAGPQYEAPSSGNGNVAKFEGARKNQSNLDYALVTTPVRTLAHFMKASKQILQDAGQLRGEINNRLLYFLALEEDEELLLGDGLQGRLHGLIPQATAFDTNLVATGATKIDQIRYAALQVTKARYAPTNVVLSPTDWADIELTKTDEGTTDNRGGYLLGSPTSQAPARLWGMPVLVSLAMTTGTFLVGNFALGSQIFDREQPGVEVATTNEADFVNNMVTILAEERLALAVYRSDAFVTGTFA